MFKIYKDNKVISTTENVVYSKRHPDIHTYIPADKHDAEIINISSLGKQYALMGNDIDGLEQVVVVESDGGADIDDINSDMGYIAETLEVGMPGEMTVKEIAIERTHKWLRRQLRKGMVWTDNNIYNITEKKQGLLQAQLLIGSLQIANGIAPEDIVLRWNISGKAHTDWNFLALTQLATDIHSHVEPMVVKQQEAEEKINDAETSEEIAAILYEFI